jgi:hypothetical protein
VAGVLARHVALWSGGTWTSLGTGLDGGTVVPAVFCHGGLDGDLYLGGSFRSAGGQPSAHIARWEVPTGSETVDVAWTETASSRELSLWPNPVTGGVLRFARTSESGAAVPAAWGIHDVTGRVVRTGTSSSAVDLRAGGAPFPAGVYFFTLGSGPDTVSRRFVVAR